MEYLWRILLVCGCMASAFCLGSNLAEGQSTRCVVLEVYVHGSRAEDADVLLTLREFVTNHPGTRLRTCDLDGEQRAGCLERLKQIAQHLQFDPADTPVVYGANRVIVGERAKEQWSSRLESLLTMDVYVRTGCPHCRAAEQFLERMKRIYPALRVRYRNIITDRQSRRDLDEVIRKHQQAATSVPVLHFCNQLIVGYDSDQTTGRRIEQALAPWTIECRVVPQPQDEAGGKPMSSKPDGWEPVRRRGTQTPLMHSQTLLLSFGAGRDDAELANQDAPESAVAPAEADLPQDEPEGRVPAKFEAREEGSGSLPLPTPGDGQLPLPNPGAPVPGQANPPMDSMEVPLLGRLSADQLGLPAFTIAVGLVDGFNPCAMWVLLFLLSILVNLKDRWRILAVAGVFVVISGLAYFAFMAAWLNVFLWVGLLRPVQVALALTAIVVGAIHIKDFFAFKQGISLSIPDSAKPGIYARVRRIVTAENLPGALIGASVLAVMVNVVELLCTAGLPALYTQILAMQELPNWQNYGYLLVYNLAYMADDALMVAVVVITLGRQKMQEKHGRILKLISGVAILVLGVVMLIRPEWLV